MTSFQAARIPLGAQELDQGGSRDADAPFNPDEIETAGGDPPAHRAPGDIADAGHLVHAKEQFVWEAFHVVPTLSLPVLQFRSVQRPLYILLQPTIAQITDQVCQPDIERFWPSSSVVEDRQAQSHMGKQIRPGRRYGADLMAVS